MTDGREELVRHRMERAGECLDDARLLLENGKYRGAVNRAYYAAFYAARAMLALRGLDASKHAGVISMFQREFVKTGVLERDTGRWLQQLFDTRIQPLDTRHPPPATRHSPRQYPIDTLALSGFFHG